MLVKLAFVMQRLKKYLKKFCHDQQRWGPGAGQFLDFMGGHSCYEGEHRSHRGPPVPPTRENPGVMLFYSDFMLKLVWRLPGKLIYDAQVN